MAAKSRPKGMKAYVLIETAPGKTKSVRKERMAGGPEHLRLQRSQDVVPIKIDGKGPAVTINKL